MNNPSTPPNTTHKELINAAINYARSLTYNIQDAEDLAQQAWLRLIKKYGKIETRAVLFTAVRNLHYDQLRRKRVVQYSPLESAPEPSKTESYGVDHDMEVALETLSENERSSILLNVVEGYTAQEISGKLHLPRGTVLSHLSRARKKLRELFSEEFGVAQPAVA